MAGVDPLTIRATRAMNTNRHQRMRAMQDKISAVTYSSSGIAVVAGLTMTDLAAIIGATVAVLSLVVNTWYRHKHYKLAEARAGVDEVAK